ncbi:MAG: ABC transporter permease subunit [Proteobacteria bacterium]|nr:ABC transporter permease subunit [Pseudomonadota bacterium]
MPDVGAEFRRRFADLADVFSVRAFRLFSIGNFASLSAIWLVRFCVGWLTWEATHSKTWLGMMAFAELGPSILISLYAGTLADRMDRLRILPAGGFPGWDAGAGPALKALALPALALALPQAAILARVTRSALVDTLGEDYIRTARAKGLPGNVVLWRHALRNALIPVLTILGLQFAFLLAGGIIIENVFYLPGLGRLVFQAITQRDLIVVEGVVILIVAAIIAINLVVDLSYAVADPRLRTRE